jgi:hypothetical protein
MRICKEPDCNRPVFSNLFCRYHQYRRRMKGGDLYIKRPPQSVSKPRSLKSNTKIPRESKKRSEATKTYKEVKDELRAEMIANGTWNCFFCGKPMGKEKGFHHTKGRDGTLYTDKKYLKPGHNDCHVFRYHQADIESLLQEVWYPDFLLRLKELDEKLWRAELKKQEKSIKLNPRIDFDEDLF